MEVDGAESGFWPGTSLPFSPIAGSAGRAIGESEPRRRRRRARAAAAVASFPNPRSAGLGRAGLIERAERAEN